MEHAESMDIFVASGERLQFGQLWQDLSSSTNGVLQMPLQRRAGSAIMNLRWRRRRMSFGPGDTEPSEFHGGLGALAPTAPGVSVSTRVTFDRRELDRILRLYGRKVAAGEWRDYAIDFLRDRAVFSVFRRTAEVPIYRIEKSPRLARRQGPYSVISATGHIVRRGHELERVLRVLDKSLSVVTR
jgi:hypothetical protein